MNLAPLIQQIDALKAAIDALRPIDAEQEGRVMQMLRLDWNYHSNAIKGNTLTLGETRAFLLHGITAKGKPFRDYLDLKGHNLKEPGAFEQQVLRLREQLAPYDA